MTPQPHSSASDAPQGLKPLAVYGQRSCCLPGCEEPAAVANNGKQGDFCCVRHKNEFHVMADRLGAMQLRQVKQGMYAKQVYERLLAKMGSWIDRPYTPPYRDVIRRLRRKGAKIETRQTRDGLRLKYQDRMLA